jgi:predicted acylesterase/phospholipase RssA
MAAASIPTLRQCNFLTLSFSGAGHLLPYHLGVAVAIKSNECSMGTPIHAVSGSSSGAIAATLFVYFPHERIKDYADRFIADGGRAMHHFKELIVEANNSAEARYRNQQSTSLANTRCSAERFVPHSGQAMSHLRAMIDDANASGEGLNPHSTTLHIATTRCSDASLRLFDFPPNLSSIPDESLVKCLEASCKIPPHFHPFDVLPSKWPSTYPEEDGVRIDGISYVDGGISAPAPPTPVDSIEGACRVVISPISGSLHSGSAIRISPIDNSWKFPLDIKCRGGFGVHPSVQNFKAMQISAGLAASTPILQEWYERGFEDATTKLTNKY